MSTKQKYDISAVLLGVCLGVASAAATGDDSEVFFGQIDSVEAGKANILLLLDTSNSMRDVKDGYPVSRLERMKLALYDFIDSSTNINIGIMRMNGTNGGGSLIFPMSDIDAYNCLTTDCGRTSLSNHIAGDLDDGISYIDTGTTVLSESTMPIGLTETGESVVSGFRFQTLNIPSNAKILSATLEFESASASISTLSPLRIRVENTGDSAPFQAATSNFGSRSLSSSYIQWNNLDPWLTGLKYTSPDISSLLQGVIDRSDWCGGNSMSFFLDGADKRLISTFEAGAEQAAKLNVTYDASALTGSQGCLNSSTTSYVSMNPEDAEEIVSTGFADRNTNVLTLGTKGTEKTHTGLRFDAMTMEYEHKILDARLEFTYADIPTGTTTLEIRVEPQTNGGAFGTTEYNISKRFASSSPPITWSPTADGAIGDKLVSPNIARLVQETVNNPLWGGTKKNIVLLVTAVGGDGNRTVHAFEGSAKDAPRLMVKYQRLENSETTASIDSTRLQLKTSISNIRSSIGTPTIGQLHEAALLFSGGPVLYGKTRGIDAIRVQNRVSHPLSYDGGTVFREAGCTDDNLSATDCLSETILPADGGPTYKSPITSACQSNHIILMTDGDSTGTSLKSDILSMTGNTECRAVERSNDACGLELAEWLFEADLASDFTGKQNVMVSTIGFNIKSDFLLQLADIGGGTYYEAENSQDLAYAYKDILKDVANLNSVYVAPGASVNQFNRLSHRDDIYFSLFRPSSKAKWAGNLKKYRVATDSKGVSSILDVNGSPAVDPATGFFNATSRSFWSSNTDGNDVAKGGAAERLDIYSDSNYRNIYTHFADTPENVDLNKKNNLFHEFNFSADMKALFGAADYTDDQFLSLIKSTRGVDVRDSDNDGSTTDILQQIGDPMHSRPVVVNYANGESVDSIIFVGTNTGMLHAINSATGDEEYAIYPKSLWKHARYYYENQRSLNHVYGMDGPISFYHDDPNRNFVIDSGETAMLYAGMRRGGNEYYAIDISQRDRPYLKWVIKGGSAGTPGFSQLGMTWSKPSVTDINVNGARRSVIIFGGGYDTNQDEGAVSVRRTDSVGNSLFIVDALSGELIWSAVNDTSLDAGVGTTTIFPRMTYGIPSDITLFDSNSDGLSDQIYVGDMGAQIWRFDINNHASSPADMVKGGVVAQFSAAESAAENRRFFYAPDLAMMSFNNKKYLTLAIGSGWRSHPLDTQTDDKFFMLRISSVFNAPEGYGKPVNTDTQPPLYEPYSEADLANVTNDINPSVDWSAKVGWVLDMESAGEKVLSSSLTFNNAIVFTSYVPGGTTTSCSASVGSGRIYAVNLRDGSPVLDLDEDGVYANSKQDRSRILENGGIPPSPALLLPEEGEPILLVGPTQPVEDLDFGELSSRTYWSDAGF